MASFLNALKAKLVCQKGQGTVEYALVTLAIVLVIAAVLVGTSTPLRVAITGAFTNASAAITNSTPAP